VPHEQRAFDWLDEPPRTASLAPLPQVASLAAKLARLAERGVYLGTSSWKYPGWLGQVYEPARYQVRGRFARSKFDRECLAEYARVFPTVGGDFAFYQFPSAFDWQRMFAQVPDGFRFSLKVPEEVTAERFPKLPRYGERAGQENPHFMDAALVRDKLLANLEPYRDKLGVLIFEFGALRRGTMSRPGRFAEALDRLLLHLPLDAFLFAVEVRNAEFLNPPSEYLDCLQSHHVAHCFNSWTRMPPIDEQLRLPGVRTAEHVAARFLLRPGRTYQQAVDLFSPYKRVQDTYSEGRAAMRALIERSLKQRQTMFAFVNNRFEGNAVQTLQAVVDSLELDDSSGSADSSSPPAGS